MPTGYTAKIAEGITFNKFALSCARAFGACIEMRDEPSDTPIPEEFKASSYHSDRIKESQKKLKELKGMSVKDYEISARKEYEEQVKYLKKDIKEKNDLKAKYDKILVSVEKYEPPSPDHVNFKTFMREQITESIKCDCSDYSEDELKKLKQKSAEIWAEETIKQCEKDIIYHQKHMEEENISIEGRNKWIKLLRESLK